MLEIPGGRIELGEDIFVALKREVKEECSLEIESIKPSVKVETRGKFDEVSVAFVPFCGERYVGSNFVGFVFVCAAQGELI